jgi:AcrR family transcriptional regulator
MATRARIEVRLPATPRKRRKRSLAPKKQPRQPRAQLTYDSILDASARILEDLGYAALTTNGVAAISGVAVGGVYAYFPNKEAIVAELVRRTVERSLKELEAVFAQAAELSDRDEALPALVRGCVKVMSRQRVLLRVLLEQVPFLHDLDVIKAFPMRLFTLAWTSRAIAKNGIADDDARARAYLFLLIPIGRWVPYTAIIERPAWLGEQEAEEAMIEIFQRLLS